MKLFSTLQWVDRQEIFGVITNGDSEFEVKDTRNYCLTRWKDWFISGQVTKGMFSVGDNVTLKVNKHNREDTGKNHSATHLLQKALKIVLGDHIKQAGSLVTADQL